MNVFSYLKQKQPIVYDVFSKAIKQGKLAHAYLLIGETGTPLKQVGEFLAKTMLCDSPGPFADERCETCRRISQGDYPDYRFYDGSQGTIKKEEVQTLIHYFEQTPLEKKGIMVYLIHCVEGMTPEAENSLLKFLEEPNPSAYAILTTRNEAKVLPTIVSRCQSLHLHLVPRDEVLSDCKQAGVLEADAELLSLVVNDLDSIQETAGSKTYQNAKDAFEQIGNALCNGVPEARFTAENGALSLLSDRNSLQFFFEMMTFLFQDVVSASFHAPLRLPSYAKMTKKILEKTQDPKKTLLSIMKLRQEVNTNINGGLLVLHMLHQMKEE